MTADETDPNQDEQSAPKPSAAPEPEGSVTDRFLSETGEAAAAPVPVETEGLADILADPEIAPAEDSAALADLLAPPAEAAPADETPGLAEILAAPDPAVFGETEPARESSPVGETEGARIPVPAEDPVPSGLPPLPALPPERPAPPLAPEGGGGSYPLLVGLVFLFLLVLLIGAVVLIAVLVGNAAWPFPVAAGLPPVLPLV